MPSNLEYKDHKKSNKHKNSLNFILDSDQTS